MLAIHVVRVASCGTYYKDGDEKRSRSFIFQVARVDSYSWLAGTIATVPDVQPPRGRIASKFESCTSIQNVETRGVPLTTTSRIPKSRRLSAFPILNSSILSHSTSTIVLCLIISFEFVLGTSTNLNHHVCKQQKVILPSSFGCDVG